MPEDIFEKEDAVETTTEETKPEKENVEGEKSGLAINIFCFNKWKKYQELSIFDFSSLQGTVTSALIVAVIALAVRCAKLSKRK